MCFHRIKVYLSISDSYKITRTTCYGGSSFDFYEKLDHEVCVFLRQWGCATYEYFSMVKFSIFPWFFFLINFGWPITNLESKFSNFSSIEKYNYEGMSEVGRNCGIISVFNIFFVLEISTLANLSLLVSQF